MALPFAIQTVITARPPNSKSSLSLKPDVLCALSLERFEKWVVGSFAFHRFGSGNGIPNRVHSKL